MSEVKQILADTCKALKIHFEKKKLKILSVFLISALINRCTFRGHVLELSVSFDDFKFVNLDKID